MRYSGVAANQVELSRCRTKNKELKRHTATYKAKLAMYNDAEPEEVDMQRMHNERQRISTT